MKKVGFTGVRYVKVHVESVERPRIHVFLYLDKPIPLTYVNSLVNELSAEFNVAQWTIYAPHGRLIRLTGQ